MSIIIQFRMGHTVERLKAQLEVSHNLPYSKQVCVHAWTRLLIRVLM